jgi:hypothetical protein
MNHTAIYNTHTNVVSIDDTEGAFDIDGNVVILDEALITAEISRLQAEYDSKQYARNRAEAYPSIADQLDDIYHNGVAGWKTSIKAVKDQYPKT